LQRGGTSKASLAVVVKKITVLGFDGKEEGSLI